MKTWIHLRKAEKRGKNLESFESFHTDIDVPSFWRFDPYGGANNRTNVLPLITTRHGEEGAW